MKKQTILLSVSYLMMAATFQGCSKGQTDFQELPQVTPPCSGEACAQSKASVTQVFFILNNEGTQLRYGWITDKATFTKGMARMRDDGNCSYGGGAHSYGWRMWQSPYDGAKRADAIYDVEAGLDGCTFDYCITSFDEASTDFTAKTEDSANSKCGSVTY